eukprot:gnl/Spiro4/6814_TR3527_c0_g1_i1.p1 gnl/Spiro4/6814_TR3527_c0_g1~~gnl/Spiro4/6814_TR3527_c0_g1_i1.p1  ORF type:complete len:462 (+),score=109.55 gnl/Spiro4/6814_TR3527_c0_g1_i1:42-1388(+)
MLVGSLLRSSRLSPLSFHVPRAHFSTKQAALSSLTFSLRNSGPGALHKCLEAFKIYNIDLCNIESRPSVGHKDDYDFHCTFDASLVDQSTFDAAIARLRESASSVWVSSGEKGSAPNLPRKMSDLDDFWNRTVGAGTGLESDHPGFRDPVYIQRRQYIGKLCENSRGTCPHIEYTEEENRVWSTVYNNLMKLLPTHACREYLHVLPLLESNCGYSPDRIPQLADISQFLKECTGFTLRPVQGLLSSRDFLNGLAFRVFHSTQYIRHGSTPMYTPEPDICHELIGHVPLFANADFADFSQNIGLASLGADDDTLKKLATCYWFTVEFGLLKQDGQLRAYGAGLLSSFGELQYCLSDKPVVKPFDPEITGTTEYPITTYQPTYFVTESFEHAKTQMISFARTIKRPFTPVYNPYTQSVDFLDSPQKLKRVIGNLQNNLSDLHSAIDNICR